MTPGRRSSSTLAGLAALTALAACGGEYAGEASRTAVADTPAADSGAAAVVARAGDLTISHAAAPAPIGDRPAAVYFTVRNDGAEADTLVAVETPAALRARVHGQRLAGGVTTMVPVAAVPVPAGATVRLAPGGLHVMLEERQGTLAVGDSLRVRLTFRRAGVVPLVLPVVSYAELEAHVGGPADAHAGHGLVPLDTLPPAAARLEGRTAGAGGELALAERLWDAPVLDSLQRTGPRADSVTLALATPRLQVGERFDLRRARITVLDSAGFPIADAPLSLEVTGHAVRVEGTTLVGVLPGDDTLVVRVLLPAVRDSVVVGRLPLVVQP